MILRNLLACLAVGSFAATAHGAEPFALSRNTASVLNQYCISCHGPKKQEGEMRLDTLAELSPKARAELLNKVQEQLHLNEMPPEEEKQPSASQRESLSNWVRAELIKSGGSKLDAKLRYPDYGNYVDHDKLFSGEIKDRPFTPARRWLVSPQIFHERVMDVFKLTGRERGKQGFYGVTNPFVLPDHSGVRDYDNSTLDGGHLLVMLTNAEWISGRQIFAARHKNKDRRKITFANPKDRWYPQKTPQAFEKIILSQSAPTDDELVAAIHAQFDCVLQRPASEQELKKYFELTRSAIELGGNTEGLRKMLVAVLLESEFLYRLEFGGGEPDTYGRMKLTPREASYSIAYALGDRGPDAQLVEAAQNGRLESKQDYEREVRRLLEDQQYFRGQVDPTLNGKHYRSNETAHPKVIRFFREFFGYPGSLKVFKDRKRSGGIYGNPGRGSQATPGWLTYEADQIVTWHVEKDQNVFENLLTSDEFFVYYNMDNLSGKKLLEQWRGVYQKLKDTDWKTKPKQVLEENLAFLKAQKLMRIKDASRPGEFVNYMHFFAESFGRGRDPFTRIPWSHGYTYHHSPFYSLPPTPSIGRYGSWKSTKYNAKLEAREFWDYPTEQPFKIANRKGILTHPAWLIAHSSNTHTDPIKRGRWIREKLLAGRVPDVPITVNAQVPEDPHKTFRERVEKVTTQQACWKCHQHMNPLGLAFEMYDDFGRYRTAESLEYPENLVRRARDKNGADTYKTKPVVTNGHLKGTGDPKLDGKVKDAIDMIDRLAKAERVRQSIIRHAFRFYLGRNERLSDSQTLIDADEAYVKSGGSFKAVVVSLLTSDSFMYRKEIGNGR